MYGVCVPCTTRPVHARHAMHVGRGTPALATPPVHARGAAADAHRCAPTAAFGHASQGRALVVATRTLNLPFLEVSHIANLQKVSSDCLMAAERAVGAPAP